MNDIRPFIPMIKELIQYYYEDLENFTGGYCHIALDDGNLTDENLHYCQELCKKHNDEFGYLIATILRNIDEKQREKMYNEDWWGMSKNLKKEKER